MKKYAVIMYGASGQELDRWEAESENEIEGATQAHKKMLEDKLVFAPGDVLKFVEVDE
jgi:hypothetical protein